MIGDILHEGCAALKLDSHQHLIFAPQYKAFVRIPSIALKAEMFSQHLRKFMRRSENLSQTQQRGPIVFVANVTERCNLTCSYCWADCENGYGEDINKDAALRLIDYVKENAGIKRVHFMGGEPTLNFPAIKRMVDHLEKDQKNPVPRLYITTNGTMRQSTLQWLIRKGFAFTVSWDGVGRQHDTRRNNHGESLAKKVERTIIQLADEQMLLRVRMTISRLNLSRLYESVQWLREQGVQFVHIEPVAPGGRGSKFVEDLDVCPDDFRQEFFRIVEYAEDNNMWVMNSRLANLYDQRDYFCSAVHGGMMSMNVDRSISRCYKVQSKSDDHSSNFVVGRYDVQTDQIGIDPTSCQALSSINVSECCELRNHPFRYHISGGCPHSNLISTGFLTRLGPDSMVQSSAFVRDAIMHLYGRSLSGKSSALEGYVVFYGRLESVSNTRRESDSATTQVAHEIEKSLKDIGASVVPVPLVSTISGLDIDACDICI